MIRDAIWPPNVHREEGVAGATRGGFLSANIEWVGPDRVVDARLTESAGDARRTESAGLESYARGAQ